MCTLKRKGNVGKTATKEASSLDTYRSKTAAPCRGKGGAVRKRAWDPREMGSEKKGEYFFNRGKIRPYLKKHLRREDGRFKKRKIQGGAALKVP